MMSENDDSNNFLRKAQLKIVIDKQSNIKEKVAMEHQSNKSLFPFAIKDINFSHSLGSISPTISQIKIEWKRAEAFCWGQPNYSQNIENLQKPCFSNRAITHGLLLLNWFCQEVFEDLFKERKIRPNSLYEYKVMVNGVIAQIYIDSYVPVKEGKHVFVQNIQNSIFPCLYEKLLAKIYGNYQSISLDPIDILQIHTCYAKQLAPFTNFPKQEQIIKKITDTHKNKGLIFFRTRNSIKLQTLGLESNHSYILTRLVKIKQHSLVEFLEIDGEGWVGKYSKVRAFWNVNHPEMYEEQLNLEEYGRQNYMCIKDLIGITREFVILHNTKSFHKNWISVTQCKEKQCFVIYLTTSSSLLITLNLSQKKYRSSMILIRKKENILANFSYKEEKSSNFLKVNIEAGEHYYLIVDTQDLLGQKVDFNLTFFCEKQFVSPQQILIDEKIQQVAFMKYVERSSPIVTKLDEKSFIQVKNSCQQLGLGFIVIFLSRDFYGKLRIQLNHELMHRKGVQLVNAKNTVLEYQGPYKTILIFKLRDRNKEKEKFPIEGSLKIFYEGQKLIKPIWHDN